MVEETEYTADELLARDCRTRTERREYAIGFLRGVLATVRGLQG